LKEEIQASKRETDEITKIEMDRIKSLKELLSSPEQHIAFLKEASEKFVKAEKQFLDADAERKRLLSEIDKQRLEADAERKKLIAEADAERKKLLAENDAERKKLIADADAERKK
jgi:regulator of protease activity HflC (stomatin/prohibitin superfamily)